MSYPGRIAPVETGDYEVQYLATFSRRFEKESDAREFAKQFSGRVYLNGKLIENTTRT